MSGPATHMIWDSKTKSCFLKGTQDELFTIKHKMEEAEQKADNKEWALKFKQELTDMLITAGNTYESVEFLLKEKMPFLYD